MEPIPYRFYLTGRSGTREAFPKNGSALAIKWLSENENAFLRKQLTGKILFCGADFDFLYYLEQSVYRCEVVELRIHSNCSGSYQPYQTAQLILNKGSWDVSRHTVEIEPNVVDLYSCYSDNADTPFNLFNYVFQRITVNSIIGTIETMQCNTVGLEQYYCGTGTVYSQGWVLVDYYQQNNDTDGGNPYDHLTIRSIWAREYLLLPPGETLPLPWHLVDVATNKWARPPAVYNYQSGSYSETTYWYKYQYGAKFDNGLRLRPIMESLLDNTCYTLTLKSNFFQWNPDVETDINYATGEASKVLNLILFQKSDIKRPNADNNATIANISLSDLIKDICNTFNLKWWIAADNTLNIEHISFNTRAVGIDATTRYDKYLRIGSNKYEYDINNIPKKETFSWSDKAYGDFGGFDIVYNNSCAGLGDKKSNDITVNNIYTDISQCLLHPAPGDEAVSDDGFVLVACDENDNILTEENIFGGSTLNNTLSWSHLHLDYWRDGRVFNTFLMNNTTTVAKSVIPTKKQSGVRFKICCGDSFNPDELITTELGNGQVQNPTLDLYKQELVTDLLYPADYDLMPNAAPVVMDDNVETFLNLPIIIDVLANDSDADGTILNYSLAVLLTPSHGTAEITSDFKIKYTPATGYLGSDFFYYNVKDNLNELSNLGIVTVLVKEGSPIPIANPDTFAVAKDVVLTVSAAGVLTNDTGDGAIVATAETKATAHGGSVTIYANGGFVYTPPAGYTGNDTFTYTLTDSNLNSTTGTATVKVFVAVPVFVKFNEQNPITSDIINICTTHPEAVGTRTVKDQRFRFYSDSAGTIPLDVTGYGLIISRNTHTVVSDGSITDDVQTFGMSDTQRIITSQLTYSSFTGCSHTTPVTTTITYTLVTSPDYTII